MCTNVGGQDTSGWDVFFNDQEEIVDNCIVSTWTMLIPFTWCIQHSRDSQTPLPTPNVINDNLLHPQQRDINVGPMTTKATKARWQDT